MRKIVKAIGLVVMSALLLSGCSEENTTPQLNEHYTRLNTDLSEVINEPVVEVFSLICGHCKQMDLFVPQIAEKIGQPIGKVHVTFNKGAQAAALFYYAAAIQSEGGVPSPEMMVSLFNIYHANQDKSIEERTEILKQAFVAQGFTSAYELDEAQQQILSEQMNRAHEITTKGQINGVPTFIVNGKFLVNTTAHNDLDDFARTISYLLTQG